ncbi:MAG: hypothetical protein Q9162_007219 [Coniocarpon cinnabarinum]
MRIIGADQLNSVCVTGIVRLSLTYIPGSEFINFSQGQLWSNIHLGSGIVCACMPLYRPLVLESAGIFSKTYQKLSDALSSRGKDYSSSDYTNDSEQYRKMNGSSSARNRSQEQQSAWIPLEKNAEQKDGMHVRDDGAPMRDADFV